MTYNVFSGTLNPTQSISPSNRLATIHQRYRQDRTGQDRQSDRQANRQRSDSIGRTVLQTVAQKSCVQRDLQQLTVDVQSDSGFPVAF